MKAVTGAQKDEVYLFDRNGNGIHFSKQNTFPFTCKLVNGIDGNENNRRVVSVYPVKGGNGIRVYTESHSPFPCPMVNINREICFYCKKEVK